MDVNEYLNAVRKATETYFPDATYVEISISSKKVRAVPHYAGEFDPEITPEQTISGGWCSVRGDD